MMERMRMERMRTDWQTTDDVEQGTLSCSEDKTTSLFQFYLFACELVVPPWTRNLLVPKSSFSCLVLLTNARKDKDFSALCELLIPLYLIDSFETNHEKGQEKSGQENENILICLSTFSHPLHCFIFSFLWNWSTPMMNQNLVRSWSEGKSEGKIRDPGKFGAPTM